MGDLDPILEAHAKKDRNAIVLAHLRRRDRDRWDTLVVGNDLMPLAFWSSGKGAPESSEIVRDEEGNVLMVILATPPGVEPAGLVAMPATEHGSPFGTLEAIVSADGYTPLAEADEEPPPPPSSELEPDMLRSLLATAAQQRSEGEYVVAEVPSADGGTVRVLLDWNGRPLLFWTDMPGDPPRRELMAVVALEEAEGLLGVTVDEELRPLHSDAELTRLMEKD
jgi:hypothetical protein